MTISRVFRSALVTVLLSMFGVTAEATAQQQPNVATLQAQVNKLSALLKSADSAIKRLDARLAKMEKDQEEKIEDLRKEEEDDDKGVASLEKRVAALERGKGDAKGESSGNDPGSTVRAPFEVRDTDGRVIFRVTGGQSPRLMIGVEKGGQVEMGTGSAGGGTLRVRDATGTDRAIIIATAEFGQYRAISRGYSAVMTASDQEGSMVTMMKGDSPSARMRSGQTGYGGFILTDPQGSELVKAGAIMDKGSAIGLVWAGPRGRAGSLGPPSQIMGVR